MALFAWAAPGGQAPTPGRGSAALRRDGLDGECARQAIIVVPRCRLAPPPNVWLGSIDYAAAYPYRFRRALQRAGSGTGSTTPTPSASQGSSLLPSSFLQLSRRQALQSTSSCSPDLAGDALDMVRTPTLLIMGGDDLMVIDWPSSSSKEQRRWRSFPVPATSSLSVGLWKPWSTAPGTDSNETFATPRNRPHKSEHRRE
jgi:hypothetical protein